MKIVFVSPEFLTEKNAGGLATYIDNISHVLADCGHDVTILVQSVINQSLMYDRGIRVIRVKVNFTRDDWNIPGGIYRKGSLIMNSILSKANRNYGFDVVQYSNWCAMGVDRTNLPSVVRVSSDLPTLRAANRWEFDVNKIYECEKAMDYLEDISILKADEVFSPSYCAAETIGRRIGNVIDVLESPIKPIIENKFNGPERLPQKYVLTFGTVKLIKGIRSIGEILYSLLDRNKELYYIIAGEDSDMMTENGGTMSAVEFLKKCAGKYADRLVYLGKLPREELFSIIMKAKVCVMPSRIDNFPNACIEAMALGKIVIGTKGASFEQLIKDGENGFLIERENPDQLLTQIEMVLSLEESTANRIGIKAKESVKRLGTDVIGEKTIEIYERAIKHAKYSRKPSSYLESIVGKYNKMVLGICDEYLIDPEGI